MPFAIDLSFPILLEIRSSELFAVFHTFVISFASNQAAFDQPAGKECESLFPVDVCFGIPTSILLGFKHRSVTMARLKCDSRN